MNPIPNLDLNILPYNGEAYYFGKIYNELESQNTINQFIESIPWKNDEVYIFGKHIITSRKMAWFSEDGLPYIYSNSVKESLLFTTEILTIKYKVEALTGEKFNACLANLYHNGAEGMGWHADNEKEITKNSAIASVSFGADRVFSFKHNSTSESKKILLENGSLLIMKGETQAFWKHSLPKSTKIVEPRVNLTFRQMKKP
jgi:alkylated DNA repair dioxygenase AlkB